ncbi:peptide/nickel transport system substrate-binding protein [Klenkia marina]|uniref:Peptide/nickel transport system substrate-binding protein n=1 Tax=Klenkia marina TaxID=1960309 RepID=A0A1G4XAB5_9ACTN|nr:ABC transporter family substrate-binding protein [Klenkia marina]SCX38176.1 peptide/nickel transport system substrate-binding protein [Klenkia marina]
MKLSKRGSALVATGIAGAMVLSACGGGSSSDGGGSGEGGSGQVVFGEPTAFPENIYPFISAGNSTATQTIIGRVLPSAFNVSPDFSVTWDENILASEPTLEDNGGQQVNTYEINPDAVWSDGTPITADDFAFTWKANRSADPADGGCEAVLSTNGYANIASVEGGGDDNKTVTVTYTEPYADWQSLFSTFLPAHLMDNEDPTALCETISNGFPIADGIIDDISAGPFQVKKENIDVGGQIVILTPNPEWWGEPAKLARLVIQNVGNDPTTTVQGLQNQELGVVYPQPQLDLVDQLDGLEPGVENKITFGLTFEHLDFNTTDPILSSLPVRQAFAMALDRQEIVDQTVGQFSSDAQVLDNRLYVNNQPEYQDNAPDEYKSQNTAQAKQLLEGDGWVLGADGIYAKGGQRLSIRIDTTANNPLRQTTIEVMIPQLKEAGIEATFNANPDIFADVDKPTSLVAGGFQAALFAWVSTPFVSSNQSIYYSPENGLGQNYSRIGTPEIDQLLSQMVSEPDPDKAADLANQVDQALWAQMATLPLYQKPTLIAYQSSISNVEDNASQTGPLWNAETWAVSS